MTDNNHPITPPPELVQQWINEENGVFAEHIATQAARWGADQELESCLQWFSAFYCMKTWMQKDLEKFRTARRPKPPSLKEQALQALYRFDDTEGHEGLTQEQIADDYVIIRHALESLPD